MGKRTAAKKEKIRIALIGAGGMANAMHYPSLVEFDDVELVGLCDLVEDKFRSTAEKFGIEKTFTDYRKMLDETKPQAVYVLMPPHHLYDIAMDVLEGGYDLFIEKPPGITVQQTRCLAHAADERKLMTGVGFQRRYHPLFEKCRRSVLRHGRISQVVTTWYKLIENTETHPNARGAVDILTYDGIHMVDLLRYCCGGKVVSVASDVRKQDCWFETCFNAIIAFDSGATGILLGNWRAGGRCVRLDLHTAGCSAFAELEGDGVIMVENDPMRTFRSNHIEAAGSDERHVHQGFRAQARAFVDAVKTRRPVHNNLTDAVETMKLVNRIYSSNISP
jgi:predicted dehydrogenase